MTDKLYTKPTVAPSHPGSILRSGFVDQYNIRVETVAAMLGLTRVHLSRILNARAPVTPDIALKLETLTETPAAQWLAMQTKYDSYQMEQVQDFASYKQVVHQWLDSALLMQPRQRNEDVISQNLVAEATRLAKRLTVKKVQTLKSKIA